MHVLPDAEDRIFCILEVGDELCVRLSLQLLALPNAEEKVSRLEGILPGVGAQQRWHIRSFILSVANEADDAFQLVSDSDDFAQLVAAAEFLGAHPWDGSSGQRISKLFASQDLTVRARSIIAFANHSWREQAWRELSESKPIRWSCWRCRWHR